MPSFGRKWPNSRRVNESPPGCPPSGPAQRLFRTPRTKREVLAVTRMSPKVRPLLPALIACALAGCDARPPEIPAAGAATDSLPPTERGPVPLKVGAPEGFIHRGAELTPGFPGVLTVDLGPRLRIYVVTGRVVPATLTLLAADGRELQTIHLGLPPGGTIRAPADLVGADVGSLRVSVLAQRGGDSPGPDENSPTVVADSEIGLQPDFGTVKIFAVPAPREGSLEGAPASFQEVHSGTFVADPWTGEGAPPDDHWLSDGVKASLTEVTSRPAARGTSLFPAGGQEPVEAEQRAESGLRE